jgi:hypothetical protein
VEVGNQHRQDYRIAVIRDGCRAVCPLVLTKIKKV